MKKSIKIFIFVFSIISIIIVLNNIFIPRFYKEFIINEFLENKKYFDIVKDYLITQEPGYRISKNYKQEIMDEIVIEAIEYLNNMNYSQIYSYDKISIDKNNIGNYYILFLKSYPMNQEFGVVYTNFYKNIGIDMERYLIESNWYYHWVGWGF